MIDEAITAIISDVVPTAMLQNADDDTFPCAVFDLSTRHERIMKSASRYVTSVNVNVFAPTLADCRNIATNVYQVLEDTKPGTIQGTDINRIVMGERTPDIIELEGNNPIYNESINFSIYHDNL